MVSRRRSVRVGLLIVILGLAVTASSQSPAIEATQENPVTRPFHVFGQLTFVDAYAGYPMTILDRGIASGIGEFVCVAKFAVTGGTAIYYAANGDQIFAKSVGNNGFEFIKGTGRFKNASGSFIYEMSSGEWIPGPDNTWNYVADYKGEGTITY